MGIEPNPNPNEPWNREILPNRTEPELHLGRTRTEPELVFSKNRTGTEPNSIPKFWLITENFIINVIFYAIFSTKTVILAYEASKKSINESLASSGAIS